MAYSGSYHREETRAAEVPEEQAAETPALELEPEPVRDNEQPQPQPHASPANGLLGRMPQAFGGLLKKIEAAGMETDDLLMALILYLMYRESGDKDLLILLGAMLLS